MSHIILPPPPPPPIILLPGNCVSWFTQFTHVHYHFTPWIHFAPWKWFNDLHYLPMSRIILPSALDFVFILIKSPLQQKLMTGAHPVTVAPLVATTIYQQTSFMFLVRNKLVKNSVNVPHVSSGYLYLWRNSKNPTHKLCEKRWRVSDHATLA